jgi:predicted dithiol-disulfide oxidoreductase (DUF899 family)
MKGNEKASIQGHTVVSREQWLAARTALLAREKEFTRLHDEIRRERRALPWVRVDKEYVFDTPSGRQSLADLFEGRSQLVVYHFMFAPEWEQGCKHCSFWADHFDGMLKHLKHRDVTFLAISRAPLAKIEAFKKRLGWKFKWVSSQHDDFNYDFQVSFRPQALKSGEVIYNYAPTRMNTTDREGLSVFYRDAGGAVFHTYSCYARGIDALNGTYQFLDLVPKGRDEEGLKSPQAWVHYHDSYPDSQTLHSLGGTREANKGQS